MKRPTWATVVGIMGIIIGCFGILGGGQFMMMPKMMEMQKEVWSGMQESIEKQETTNPQQMPPKGMWHVPDWFDTYCMIAGIAAVFVSGFYVFSSIRLLQTKPTAIRLFYSAAGLAIGFTILRSAVAVVAMSFMGMAMMMGGMFGVVINVVLLIVVATGNKGAFASQEA